MSALITISTHCISDLLHSGDRHEASCKREDWEPVENPPSENLKQMLIFENPPSENLEQILILENPPSENLKQMLIIENSPSDYQDLDMKVKVGQYNSPP